MSDNLLVLKKIRIRGLGTVVDTNWFTIGNNLTYFAMPSDFDKKGFFSALQAINPPYTILEKKPFRDYPLTHRDGKYQKRVRPDRRTITLTIFVAQPETVMMLGEITPHLYETDRIEVGRKMDYSRWLNFVEIASSSRWSEVEDALKEVMKRYSFAEETFFADTVAAMRSPDRIKGATLEILEKPLMELVKKTESDAEKKFLKEILFVVQRQRHFNTAKVKIEAMLPSFLYFNIEEMLAGEYAQNENKSALHLLMGKVDAVIDHSKKLQQSRPIFLFDEESFASDAEIKQEMRKYADELSSSYQCLYMLQEGELVGEKDAVKVIRFSDLFS